jgi:aryl-alcohol dehydrogenase-like predicted oxidoreductase
LNFIVTFFYSTRSLCQLETMATKSRSTEADFHVAKPSPPPSALARHRQLAPNANLRVSPLCLGTMNFGEAQKAHLGECSKETSFEILDTFVTSGGNFIDTANVYHNEESEQWLGEWMASRKNRDSLVVATKYGGAYKKYDVGKYGCQSNFGGSGTKSMKRAIEDSLKNLQTEYVDLFYLHYWDYTSTIPELMLSLNDLVVSGKVHYLGISDTPAWVVSKVSNTPFLLSNVQNSHRDCRQINTHEITVSASSLFTKAHGMPQCAIWSVILSPCAATKAWESVPGPP